MISIITSLYRSEKHLPSMLKHVSRVSAELEKADIVHEFIFLPNNPSDLENELLDTFCMKNFNAKKITRPLEPLYATWNAGIENAVYENVTFWNADDQRFSPALIDGLNILNNGADIVYFPFIYKRYVRIFGLPILAKIKKFMPPEFDRARFSKEMHGGPFFMTTKLAMNKVGYFDPSFKIAGDFNWLARSALKGLDFKRSSVVAGIFKNDGTTLSGSKNNLLNEENARIYMLSK